MNEMEFYEEYSGLGLTSSSTVTTRQCSSELDTALTAPGMSAPTNEHQHIIGLLGDNFRQRFKVVNFLRGVAVIYDPERIPDITFYRLGANRITPDNANDVVMTVEIVHTPENADTPWRALRRHSPTCHHCARPSCTITGANDSRASESRAKLREASLWSARTQPNSAERRGKVNSRARECRAKLA